jgi:hypothetical protein
MPAPFPPPSKTHFALKLPNGSRIVVPGRRTVRSKGARMGRLKKVGGGVLWLLLAVVCLYVPLNALVRLITTGDLLMVTSRYSTAGPVAQPFSRGYFASLGFYVFAGFLGLAFGRTALVESFGIGRGRFRRAFIGLLLAVFTLFLVLPIAISIWRQIAS